MSEFSSFTDFMSSELSFMLFDCSGVSHWNISKFARLNRQGIGKVLRRVELVPIPISGNFES